VKSVPNLISYLHNFFWNFSQFLAIYFELFSSGGNFNTKIADMRGPSVSRRFPRRCPDSRLPTVHLASCAPTALSPTASPHAPPAAVVRSRPRVFERADAVVYPFRAQHRAAAFSRLPATLTLSTVVLVGHRRTVVPPDAGVHASPCHPMPSFTPTSSCRATIHAPVRPHHAFPGRLPCAGEVAGRPSWARPWAARAVLAEAEPGQAGSRTRCAGRRSRHCATGPWEDWAE
jgi:hypothetical protein